MTHPGSAIKNTSWYQHIIYDRNDGVAKITINRPEVKNALSVRSNEELFAALKDAESDDNIRVVIITGSGDSFCAGMDVKDAQKMTTQSQTYVSRSEAARESRRFMTRMRKPIIAAINGYALGGGLELAMYCDLRIATKTALMGLVETSIGMVPGNGGTQRLPRLVGMGKAKEMIFLAKRITGEEAEKLGLVNRAIDQNQFWNVVDEITGSIKERAPLAIAYAKAAMNRVWESGLEDGLMFENYYSSLNYASEDREEGFRAFLEKRKPIWKFK
ncbi:MAG TPA: enoyl-CoA hydratase-related protein [Nitrososphaerales archaeon]|nr:enoyl-CoA hydratase-related protein [Nitrososphaerales archaeon]